MLNDTLEFFQHEHFKHKTSRDQVIYQTLVFEAMGCTKSLAASRNVSLKQDLFPKDEKAVIVTDRTKTIQIVSNLVNNAIKFTNNGQVAIKFRLFENSTEAANEMMEASAEYEAFVLTRESHAISACRDEAFKSVASQDSGVNQKWLYFSVTDNGTGISSPDLLRILEPYTQLANAEQSSIRGTGLGLSICVALSHQLGGFLACASTLGVGTTFFVILPVEVGTTNSKADGADDEETASPLSCKNKIPLDGPILLVDDNLVNIKILNRSMQFELKRADRDVELLQATGGAEAIDLFKANRPSLCIIDYHMPEVDGIEATRAIRNFELEHDLEPSHIICYTADVTEEAQTRLLACGMNEIMTKPPPKGFITNLVSRLEDKKKDVETSSSHLMVHAQKYFGLSLGPHHSHPTHRLPVEINL